MAADPRPTTEQIAAHLGDVGVRAGDRVAVHLPPGPARSAAAHACWQVGATVVIFAPGVRQRHQVAALGLVRPVVVLADRAGLRATRRCPSVRVYVAAETLTALGQTVRAAGGPGRAGAGPDLERGSAPHHDPDVDADADADADAAIIFTRGEDGHPTGVFYTRREIASLREMLTARLEAAASIRPESGPLPRPATGPSERHKTAPTLVEIVLLGIPAAHHLTFTAASLVGTGWPARASLPARI